MEKEGRKNGLSFGLEEVGQLKKKDFTHWCKKMARELKKQQNDLAGKFRLKWYSIWDLARYLNQFASEDDFRDHFFDGKTQGRDLCEKHVKKLAKMKRESGRLSMIGHANRYFILRNLGGDFLKPDVWVKEFARWYGKGDVVELATMLRRQGIHCGRFDLYLWSYCEREVQKTSRLRGRFNQLFNTD